MHRDSVAPSELLIRDEHAIGGYHRRLVLPLLRSYLEQLNLSKLAKSPSDNQ
jgi:hypothetical protein